MKNELTIVALLLVAAFADPRSCLARGYGGARGGGGYSGSHEGSYSGNHYSGSHEGGYSNGSYSGSHQGSYNGANYSGSHEGGYSNGSYSGSRQGSYNGANYNGSHEGSYSGGSYSGSRQGTYNGANYNGSHEATYSGTREGGAAYGAAGYHGGAGYAAVGYRGVDGVAVRRRGAAHRRWFCRRGRRGRHTKPGRCERGAFHPARQRRLCRRARRRGQQFVQPSGHVRRGLVRRAPSAWQGAGWSAASPWTAAAWPALGATFGWGAGVQPIAYNYGTSVVYQGNQVYADGQPIATADEYYQQAADLAQAAPAPADGDADWMPLGTFGLVRKEESDPAYVIQLAVDKSGAVAGNYCDMLTDQNLPVHGAVDQQTQKLAWTVGDKTKVVGEVGLYNLTQNEAPALIHIGKDKTQQWLLVRLKQPDAPPVE